MPNWCSNKLVITGPKEDRKKFLQDLFIAVNLKYDGDPSQAFTFSMVLPMPKDLVNTISPRPMTQDQIRKIAEENNWPEESLKLRLEHALSPEDAAKLDGYKAKYGSDNWYDWCNKNWGTKWDAVNSSVNAYARGITIHYETAWCPPVGVLHALAAKYPTLTFRNTYSIEGYPGTDVVIGSVSEYESWLKEQKERQEQINLLAANIAGV